MNVELPAGSIRDLSVLGWWAAGQPAWSPDARTIFVPFIPANGTTIQIWAFDAHTGTHRPLTSGSTNYLQWTLSATATGDLIANTTLEILPFGLLISAASRIRSLPQEAKGLIA